MEENASQVFAEKNKEIAGICEEDLRHSKQDWQLDVGTI